MYRLISKLKLLKTTVEIWVKESCPDPQKALTRNKEKLNSVQVTLGNTHTNYSLEVEERNLLAEHSMPRQMELMDMCQRVEEGDHIRGQMLQVLPQFS